MTSRTSKPFSTVVCAAGFVLNCGQDRGKGMTASSWIFAVGLAGLLAACGPSAGTTSGTERGSGSTVSTVTWTDGQPAYSITCAVPGGCQDRALAMCNGKYTTLKSENMPMPGTVRSVQGQPAVVVRCG